MRAPVVCAGDRPEPLLASCVPDLQLYAQSADVHGADLEVYSDRGDITARERVVREADEQR